MNKRLKGKRKELGGKAKLFPFSTVFAYNYNDKLYNQFWKIKKRAGSST